MPAESPFSPVATASAAPTWAIPPVPPVPLRREGPAADATAPRTSGAVGEVQTAPASTADRGQPTPAARRSPSTFIEYKTSAGAAFRPAAPLSADDPATQNRSRWATHFVLEWLAVVAAALLVALAVKVWVIQAFVIPSGSMISTLEIGDRVLVNKLTYDLSDVKRGDVIVFHRPPAAMSPGDTSDLIKRVIGLPGDNVSCRDGHVVINGVMLAEPWLPVPVPTNDCQESVQLGRRQLFMMGDNRLFSRDSRFFGPVDADLMVGQALVRIWPLSRIHTL